MNTYRTLSLSILSLAVLAACSSLPADNPQLMSARSDYQTAQNTPASRDLAPAEMRQANEALQQANAAWDRHDNAASVDHLAYIAKQRVAIAREVGDRKLAEQAVAQANSKRDQIRLAARTQEADTARMNAERAQAQVAGAKAQTTMALADADQAKRQADEAQVRTYQLETQLRELNAKQTDRGMVITIGDVLFDSNQAQLKAGGIRQLDKLVGFMKQYPQRKVLIEGYADSTGNEDSNQSLSTRRADAVRSALVGQGVAGERVTVRGNGEAFPVASNDNASGRQMNRRVEVILSDTEGRIVPRP